MLQRASPAQQQQQQGKVGVDQVLLLLLQERE
jgi:hypothetical protein